MENKKYRLEFNEQQQAFHLDYNNRHEENTFGWETIKENHSDFEDMIFISYVNRQGEKKHTTKQLKQSIIEIKNFIENLAIYNLEITRKNGK
jgi:hypothetical protein